MIGLPHEGCLPRIVQLKVAESNIPRSGRIARRQVGGIKRCCGKAERMKTMQRGNRQRKEKYDARVERTRISVMDFHGAPLMKKPDQVSS